MIGQYEKETLTYRSPQNYLTSRTIKATMTLKQNWTVAISWVQSLKWRTRQIYQHLKKAVEITSHFISVNLIYNAVSTVWYTQNDFHPLKNAADNQICQSQLSRWSSWCKAREKRAIAFGFPSYWLSKSHEVFRPIKKSQQKRKQLRN